MILQSVSIAFLVGLLATWLIRKNAARLGLVQAANERSSHVGTIPTGGGAGLVAGAIAGSVNIALADPFLGSVLLLGLVMALLGLADDRWPLPARYRLAIHFICVGLVVIASGIALRSNPFGDFGVIAITFALLIAGTWWVNLFNFMDGIDGLAAVQGLTMCFSGIVLALISTGTGISTHPLFAAILTVFAATAGFLIFNWPRASIFMGDSGSLFLGLMLFAFAVLSSNEGWVALYQWAILGTLFAADATVTLVRRGLRGENVMQAHRSHAYQRLARRFESHLAVTLGFGAINLFVLLPLAYFVRGDATLGWVAAAVAFGCASVVAWRCGAGTRDRIDSSFRR